MTPLERQNFRARRLVLPLLLLGTAFCPAACSSGGTSTGKEEDEKTIVQEKERGPVKVTLRVEPREPTFADRIFYRIHVQTKPGVKVTMPDPGKNLGEFLIKDFLRFPEKTAPNGDIEIGQSYVLEVLTSGEYTIPETTIAFTDEREKARGPEGPPASMGDGPEETGAPKAEEDQGTSKPVSAPQEGPDRVFKILTDPMKIQVRSLDDTAALDDLRPIAGPVEPPRVLPGLKWPLIVAGGLAGVAAFLYLAFRLRRQRQFAPPPIPPEEIAYRELEWLLSQGFHESGQLKEFFFHLSRIIREYIERRFGLKAPERTTEEFLDELSRSSALVDSQKLLLKRFLERADLVKFAKYAPQREEIEGSFEAAKELISETRRTPEEVASGVR